jgi:type IV secretory pathway TraG/TraD family ATPase VirD4
MDWPAVNEVLHSGKLLALTAAATLAVAGSSRILRLKTPHLHKRGVLIQEAASIQRRTAMRKRVSPGLLSVAGIAISKADETKHFKFIGTTGTGKSTAIRELLGGAIARGDRVIFADPDAGYLANFYSRRRGDIVLNPFEPESAKWDLFAEIQNAYDVEQLASGLIPSCEDPSAREWRGYARTFLAAVLRRCYLSGRRDLADLWRLLTVASVDELRAIVDGSPAQPFLDPDNARMFGSIRSITGSAIAALEYIQGQRARSFSIRHWVKTSTYQNLLFIPYRANQIASLRSMIATWMRLAIFEAMSQTEQSDRRLWFVVDELDALGAIDGLKDALARLRKFGGCCVLGFQAISQVSGIYGHEAQAIVENCGNTLILRCSASENGGTSQFASRLIGEREVLRRQVSRGRERQSAFSSGARHSRSITDQQVTETAVMPSELEQLPDLSGYFKAASSATWLKVAFGPSGYRRGCP